MSIFKLLTEPFASVPRKGGGQSGTQTTTQKSEPWSGQQPYLRRGFQEAERQFDSDQPAYFPGQTYTDFDPATQQALQMQESRAVAGNPLVTQAQNEIGATLGGDYLREGNPHTTALTNRIAGDVRQGVDSSFAGAGRYGSGLHAQSLARGIGDAVAPIHYQNYARERGAMQDAAQLAPGLAREDYADIGQLANVGQVREAKQGEALAEDIDRFNYGQNIDRMKLADYMGLIQGNYGGVTQQSQPVYGGSGLGSALGGAASGAGLGIQAAPFLGPVAPFAPFIGGGLGALGGLL